MLSLTLTKPTIVVDGTNEIIHGKSTTIQLEHSLVSLRKWEAKYHKPFLTKDEKTISETIEYIKCMTITQHVPDDMYNYVSDDDIRKVNAYMDDPMTATWFSENKSGKGITNNRVITAELIYYWMIALHIPQEYQKWHLNQLITLIKTCDAENNPQKKRSQGELTKHYAALNEERRKKFNTKG